MAFFQDGETMVLIMDCYSMLYFFYGQIEKETVSINVQLKSDTKKFLFSIAKHLGLVVLVSLNSLVVSVQYVIVMALHFRRLQLTSLRTTHCYDILT